MHIWLTQDFVLIGYLNELFARRVQLGNVMRQRMVYLCRCHLFLGVGRDGHVFTDIHFGCFVGTEILKFLGGVEHRHISRLVVNT